MRRALVLACMILITAAGCEETVSTEPAANEQSDDGGSGGDGGADGSTAADGSATDDDDSTGTTADPGDQPDNDDAAEIVGNPDLDLDELAEIDPDTAEALDDIDDIVSIGACRSEFLGLEMTYVPEMYECRVMDQVTAGLDGFTLFKPENAGGIEITIGSPIPGLGSPCDIEGLCGPVEPLDLGGDFDVSIAYLGAIPLITGEHANGALLTITLLMAPTEDDFDFMKMVVGGVKEI